MGWFGSLVFYLCEIIMAEPIDIKPCVFCKEQKANYKYEQQRIRTMIKKLKEDLEIVSRFSKWLIKDEIEFYEPYLDPKRGKIICDHNSKDT